MHRLIYLPRSWQFLFLLPCYLAFLISGVPSFTFMHQDSVKQAIRPNHDSIGRTGNEPRTKIIPQDSSFWLVCVGAMDTFNALQTQSLQVPCRHHPDRASITSGVMIDEPTSQLLSYPPTLCPCRLSFS